MFAATEFLKGILFEENPFEEETPDEVVAFDLNGNEVTFDEAE